MRNAHSTIAERHVETVCESIARALLSMRGDDLLSAKITVVELEKKHQARVVPAANSIFN